MSISRQYQAATYQFRAPHPLQFIFFLATVAVTLATFVLTGALEGMKTAGPMALLPTAIVFCISQFITSGFRIAAQWEKAVILRAGKYRNTISSGLFWVMPFVDQIAQWVDERVQVTSFNAEQTLTKDTVPVDVDAVVFWHVWDAEKATLEVKEYQAAIFYKAQTNLRDVIGETHLSDLLVGRKMLGEQLQGMLDKETEPWGITIQSVEIRDIVIPPGLQEAMSRQAQAERERQARVILGDSERQIAESFIDAGKAYEDNPLAMHLRAMNMLYEGLKEKGALVIVPSSAVETMGLGGIMSLSTLQAARQAGGAPPPPQ